ELGTELPSAEPRVLPTQLIEGHHVADPCLHGPGCASVMQVGSPVWVWVFSQTPPYSEARLFFLLPVSHVLKQDTTSGPVSGSLCCSAGTAPKVVTGRGRQPCHGPFSTKVLTSRRAMSRASAWLSRTAKGGASPGRTARRRRSALRRR